MAVIDISLQDDKDYLTDHQDHVRRAQSLSRRAANLAVDAANAVTERDAALVRVRRAFVRQNAGFDGAAEDPITDFVVEVDENGAPIKIHTNADAVAARAAGVPLL